MEHKSRPAIKNEEDNLPDTKAPGTERWAGLETMARHMAHEIRNPLGSIILNLDLATLEFERLARLSSDPSAEGQGLVEEMRKATAQIQHVLDECLQLVQPPKIQLAPVIIKHLFEDRLAVLRPNLERARISLATDFDDDCPPVPADGPQLWETMARLIHNSQEAMPDGGRILISGGCRDNHYILRVADNGRGMSAEQGERLFQPFFTTKRQHGGIGLARAQRVIAEHGGKIECETTGETGTTFVITLPLDTVAETS